MSNHDHDPFAKYDKLFDEQDKKSVVQPTKPTEKKNPRFNDLNDDIEHQSSSRQTKNVKAIRIIMMVFFVVLALQTIPVLMFANGGVEIAPVLGIIFFIVVMNVLIKLFKR